MKTSGYGPARQREHDIMHMLARAICGQQVLDGISEVEDLRQLGYAAQLARGRVEDPEDILGHLSRTCRAMTDHLPKPDLPYRDAIQAGWGARHNMDPHKLKTELALHILKQHHRV